MKILSYNVNGIRAAMRKGLVDWLADLDIDVVCLQETKASPEQVDMAPFEALGYSHHWHSATSKKGYSGVLTMARRAPDRVVEGCGLEVYDCEGRILRTDFGDVTLLNCYFPSGTMGEARQAVKMQFLDDFYQFVHELKTERSKLIIVGDYNIAHQEIDIHDPVRNKNTTGFLPEERAWMTKWFDGGFIDTFRHLNPDQVAYSWWSQRAGVRAANKGWRIDYQSVSTDLGAQLRAAHYLPDAMHSDHCPVYLEIDL